MPKNSAFIVRIASNVRTIEVKAPDMDTANAEAKNELATGEVILSTTLKSYQMKQYGGDDK